MASELQLKEKMMAAIAKKKQESQKSTSSTSATKADPKKITSPITPKTTATEPPPPAMIQKKKNDEGAVFSEVEWSRIYYGHPVKIAVFQKQIYYAVPDVLEISNSTDEQIKYDELITNDQAKKTIASLARYIMFPSPNGGSVALYAATTDNMISIMHKFDFKQAEDVEKWLTDTTDLLMIVVG